MHGFPTDVIKDIYKGRAPAAPFQVTLHITDLCNLRCEFCMVHSFLKNRRVNKGHASLTWVKGIVKELAEMGTKEICVLGRGEPSFHPKFAEIVEFIKEHKIKLDIYTNLSASLPRAIHAYSLADSLLINLSAVDQGSYKAVKGIESEKTFRQVLSNIAYIKKARAEGPSPRLNIAYILDKNNFRFMEKAITLAESNGIDSIQFKNMISLPETKCLVLNNQERIELVKIITGLLERKFKVESNLKGLRMELLSDQKTTHSFSHCYIGWYTLSIEQNGHLTLCCRNRLLYIGQYKKNNLQALWTGPEAQRFRMMGKDCFSNKKLFGEQCSYCSFAKVNSYIENVLSEHASTLLTKAPEQSDVILSQTHLS